MNKLSIVAIDASLTGFAICKISSGGEITQKEISTKPVKTLKGRVNRMRSLAESTAAIVKEDPCIVFIEEYSYGSRSSSVVTLGELGMLVRDRVVDHAELVVEVPPTCLKKFATGKGNASKVLVASSLSSKFSKIFKTDNEADAFGLAQMGLCVLEKNKYKLTKPQLAAIQVIKDKMEVEKNG